ncbi:hypothetical protein BSLA_01r4927 [Burkholderia stabilis]|nr:hypothetical protein BSLA_01r4927 [Burkholderia stabilis]
MTRRGRAPYGTATTKRKAPCGALFFCPDAGAPLSGCAGACAPPSTSAP